MDGAQKKSFCNRTIMKTAQVAILGGSCFVGNVRAFIHRAVTTHDEATGETVSLMLQGHSRPNIPMVLHPVSFLPRCSATGPRNCAAEPASMWDVADDLESRKSAR